MLAEGSKILLMLQISFSLKSVCKVCFQIIAKIYIFGMIYNVKKNIYNLNFICILWMVVN